MMLLAFDVGTTSLKGALFDRGGGMVVRAEAPLDLVEGDDPLRHESDATEWINALAKIVDELGCSRAAEIEAIVVSGNGPTLVPVGVDGRPLAGAMTWLDRRGIEEARLVSERAGYYVDPTFFLPKALWILKNRPELYEQTWRFLPCPEYVDFVLTGEAVTFLPSAEYKRYIWEDSLIAELGMEPSKFPGYVRSGEIVGRVSRAAEAATGIPTGVPVVAGGPDFIVSLLGTATVNPGRACDRSGTSEGINLCSSKPIEDARLLCLSHIVEGRYNVSGMISTSGKALEWFKSVSGLAERDYESLFAETALAAPGSGRLLFLPYLAGERAPVWDPNARGCFVGLTLAHEARDMARAVMESVGYAVRDVLEVMAENGLVAEDLRITGTPARSAVWNQIRADITGKRILVPELSDAELVGDLCLGLYALGDYDSLAEAAERVFKVARVFQPDPERSRRYDELFGLYRESYQRLKGLFEKLATQRSVV